MSFHSNQGVTSMNSYGNNIKPREIRVDYATVDRSERPSSIASSQYETYLCHCPRKLALFTKYTWILILLVYIIAVPILLSGLYTRLLDTRQRLKITEEKLKLHLLAPDGVSIATQGPLRASNQSSSISEKDESKKKIDYDFWMKDYKSLTDLKTETNSKIDALMVKIAVLEKRLDELRNVENWLNDTYGNTSKPQREDCGCRGLPGFPGSPGRTGKKGERGEPGAEGKQGPIGFPGLKGSIGDRGPKGEPGACHCKFPPGAVGGPGPRGPPGPVGPPGPASEKGSSGVEGNPGPRGESGPPGLQGERGERGLNGTCLCGNTTSETSDKTAVYVRWGRSICPLENNDMVYAGYIGASFHTHDGGGSNYLCMPNKTVYDRFDDSDGQQIRAEIHGVEYEFEENIFHSLPPGAGSKGEKMYFDALCTVCMAKGTSSVVMIPGTTECPKNWRAEYSGYVMAQGKYVERTEFICVDAHAELRPETREWKQAGLLSFVETQCGPLPCPPYFAKRELACVVCSN